MKQATRERLNALNRRFYASQADAFSHTRSRPWRGFARVLERVRGPTPRVLDIGCGNGRLAGALQRRFGESFEYVGIDASAALLEIAQARHAREHVRFMPADFVCDDPEQVLLAGEYELVALFGVLHHVPSEPARRALLRASARRLAATGLLALTLWRFDRDPRFAQRRVPLERDGPPSSEPLLTAGELDPGDHLLRWGTSGDALRYCHFTDESELGRLLLDLELIEVERFVADGANDALNDYRLLRPSPCSSHKLGPPVRIA